MYIIFCHLSKYKSKNKIVENIAGVTHKLLNFLHSTTVYIITVYQTVSNYDPLINVKLFSNYSIKKNKSMKRHESFISIYLVKIYLYI